MSIGPGQPVKSSTKVKPRFVNLARPGRLDREFIFGAVKGLSLRGRGSQLPLSSKGGIVGERFVGVGLAVPQDAAATQLTLSLVGELDVKAVRIDFSESNKKDALLPLLEGLRSSGVGVLLHLVQPLAQAQQMPDAANEAWKCFVADALDTFAEYIEAVEIGTTINRAKWAGYDLNGFLVAWETAFRLVKGSWPNPRSDQM